MKKLLFTVYMMFLFIFSAIAHPHHREVKANDHAVIVVKKIDRPSVNRKAERVIRHSRLYRREARVERRIHRAHRRHIHRHH